MFVAGRKECRAQRSQRQRAGAFATGRLTCIVIEGSAIVELVDVRDWIGNAGRIQLSQHPETRMQSLPQSLVISPTGLPLNLPHAHTRGASAASIIFP